MTQSTTASAHARLVRGKPLADAARDRIVAAAERIAERGARPHLTVVVASADPAAVEYAQAKAKRAGALGIRLTTEAFEPARGQAALEAEIARLSVDPSVHGVMLDLPVAKGLDAEAAIARIAPHKDVDGLTPHNLGLIAAGQEARALAPATPLACIALAEEVQPLRGSRVALIGRGRSVGRSLLPMLVNRDATVTVCHTRTPDLAAAIAPCDVVMVAAGRPGLVTASMVAAHHVVVDAGITVVDGAVTGDVAAEVVGVVRALTPVPGGVGPLTSTLIFENLIRAMGLQGVPGADRLV